MTLVDNKNNALTRKPLNFSLSDSSLACFDVAHLLDRGDDEHVSRVITRKRSLEHCRILGTSNISGIIGKRLILLKRLRTKLNAIHKENHFVGIFRISNELRRLKTRHGFA